MAADRSNRRYKYPRSFDLTLHFAKMKRKIDKIFEDIQKGNLVKKKQKKEHLQELKIKWFTIGQAITQGYDFELHREMRLSARRTYQFYQEDYGNWEGPSPRSLGKLKQEEFDELFMGRKGRGETLLDFTFGEEEITWNEPTAEPTADADADADGGTGTNKIGVRVKRGGG